MNQSQSALPSRFLTQSASSTPTAHHHHHIHPPSHLHHHHLTGSTQPRTATTGPNPTPTAPAVRKPTLRISNQAVLDAVKHLPRNHLGSELYDPKIELAGPRPVSTVTNAPKDGVRRVYKPSREFTEKDLNCTFTIRIPRFYLLPSERQRVCADRVLWGCDIYTDDSDPLAAAIHAGWIRGEWSEDVDTAQLGLAGPFPQDLDDEGVPEVVLDPPATGGGFIPPADMDLHVTLLVLPALKRYAEAARNGVLSRAWGPNHDGCSVSVLRLMWVDEGCGRAMARTGAARRQERRRKWEAGGAVRGMIRAEKEAAARAAEQAAPADVRMEDVNGGLGVATPLAIAAA